MRTSYYCFAVNKDFRNKIYSSKIERLYITMLITGFVVVLSYWGLYFANPSNIFLSSEKKIISDSLNYYIHGIGHFIDFLDLFIIKH